MVNCWEGVGIVIAEFHVIGAYAVPWQGSPRNIYCISELEPSLYP